MNPPSSNPQLARLFSKHLTLIAVVGPATIAAYLHWHLWLAQSPLALSCSFWKTVSVAGLVGLAVVLGISPREITFTSTIPVRLVNLALFAAWLVASGLASWVALVGVFWDIAWILTIRYRNTDVADSRPDLCKT